VEAGRPLTAEFAITLTTIPSSLQKREANNSSEQLLDAQLSACLDSASIDEDL
jgi:organic hydroperoxide reductase OsmC/OhrA